MNSPMRRALTLNCLLLLACGPDTKDFVALTPRIAAEEIFPFCPETHVQAITQHSDWKMRELPQSPDQWVELGPGTPKVDDWGPNFHPLRFSSRYIESIADIGYSNPAKFDPTYGRKLVEALNWLESNELFDRSITGTIVLRYPKAFGIWPAGFISSMSQGALANIAAMAYYLTGDAFAHEIAVGALQSFLVESTHGGLAMQPPGAARGLWFLEYASQSVPRDQTPFVLNGFLFALGQIASLASIDNNRDFAHLWKPILEEGYAALKDSIAFYEMPFNWTHYDLTGDNRATAHYHLFQATLLREIGCYYKDNELISRGGKWIDWYLKKTSTHAVVDDFGIQIFHELGTYPHVFARDEYGALWNFYFKSKLFDFSWQEATSPVIMQYGPLYPRSINGSANQTVQLRNL